MSPARKLLILLEATGDHNKAALLAMTRFLRFMVAPGYAFFAYFQLSMNPLRKLLILLGGYECRRVVPAPPEVSSWSHLSARQPYNEITGSRKINHFRVRSWRAWLELLQRLRHWHARWVRRRDLRKYCIGFQQIHFGIGFFAQRQQ
jgi:hypothetical protein